MSKITCGVCGREIDSRGLSGHMKTHKKDMKKAEDNRDGDDGVNERKNRVISYPSNDPGTAVKQDVVPEGAKTPDNVKQLKKPPVKKRVKKQVASKPASSTTSNPASKSDPRGEHDSGSKSAGHPPKAGVTEAGHKKEWQGLFR